MQCVILAGGLGTRLSHLTNGLPKPLADVNGRPFLDYQLDLLRRSGIDETVLCVGYLGDKIREHIGDGHRYGMQIRYSSESAGLLGTAGAVKQAEDLLEDSFYLTYADAYLPMDYQAAGVAFQRSGKAAMMVVLHNKGQYERSNLVVRDGMVQVYDKINDHPFMEYINYGVVLHRKDSLDAVPDGEPYSQEEWYGDLISRRELAAIETPNRFFEIGSPGGLEEFRMLASAGTLP
jgi:N-acetyl-alpha-D-muramate 1-phosphate uridylyltransferase